MKRLLIGTGVAAVLALHLYAADGQDYRTLNEISVQGNTVTMTLSGKTKYHAFTISNPPRIVVEFANTEFNARQKELAVESGLVKRVRGGQFRNEPVKAARIVVDLNRAADYQLNGSESQVRLSLIEVAATPKTPASDTVPSASPELSKKQSLPAAVASPVKAATKPAEVKQQPVKAASDTVDLSKEAAAVAALNTPVLDDEPVVLAQPEENKSKPIAFAVKKQPAKAGDTAQAAVPAETKPADQALNGGAAAKAVPQSQQTTVQQSSSSAIGRVTLPQKPITFDFEEADIRDVLRILSMKSGINIIHGADVSGTLTLRLENVPFDQAFSTILSLKGLVSQEQGPNILRVVTPQKIADERSQAVTFTKIFPLNYAKADEIKANLDAIRNAEGRRGSVSFDPRTNSLIVTDTPEGLASIERIIGELDRRPAQVIIEAKIVEVALTNSIDLGIQWQYAGTVANNTNQQVFIGGTKASTSDSAMGAGASAGATVVSPLSVAEGGTGVAFPASSVNGQMASFAFGIVSNETRITGILNALAQKGLSKLLSNPKVTTINNKEAKILVGQRIPYTTTTVSQSGSTQQTNFLDVGVKLTVTPTINIDQKITLQVHPEVSLFIRADPAGPVIGTREAQTTVIVNSGETVVIGGLITDDDRKLGTQVPLLGDLPVIGHLFKRDYKTKDRTELLVFLTPLILE